MRPFGYYYLPGFVVDVFGFDDSTDQYLYSVETDYSSKIRRAKRYYKSPDKRNEWIFPCGSYIYIITPLGEKMRLFLK